MCIPCSIVRTFSVRSICFATSSKNGLAMSSTYPESIEPDGSDPSSEVFLAHVASALSLCYRKTLDTSAL